MSLVTARTSRPKASRARITSVSFSTVTGASSFWKKDFSDVHSVPGRPAVARAPSSTGASHRPVPRPRSDRRSDGSSGTSRGIRHHRYDPVASSLPLQAVRPTALRRSDRPCPAGICGSTSTAYSGMAAAFETSSPFQQVRRSVDRRCNCCRLRIEQR